MHYPEMWGEVMFVPDPISGTRETVFAASAEHRSIAAAMKLMEVYHLQRSYQERHGSFAGSAAQLEGLSAVATGLDDLAGLDWTLIGEQTRFLATLSTPEGIFTVDETGRLRREPLTGLPTGAGESDPQR